MRKWQRRVLIAGGLVAIAGGALVLWRARTLDRLERRNTQAFQQAVEDKDFLQARALLDRLPEDAPLEQWRAQLQQAEFDLAVKRHDARSVWKLAEASPSLLDGRGDARLLLARAAMHAGDEEQYARNLAPTEPESPARLLLQADRHLRAGQTAEAQELLESHTFTGTDEANRLIRLALLAKDDPDRVRELLSAAIQADRGYAEPYAFRGQLFEAMERWQAARADYVAALVIAPDKPLFWDQLAGFYCRRQNYTQAVDTWTQGYERTGTAEFWIKAWFWQKLSGGGEELPPPPAEGPWAPYAGYLSLLPSDEYWDATAFSQLPYASRLLEQRQETYWLRLLAALRTNDLTTARDLLGSDPFANRSWAPGLKSLCRAILQWRQGRPFSLPKASGADARHQLYDRLEALNGEPPDEAPAELAALLNNPDAWSACVLTEGWLRAAVNLSADTASLSTFPDWYRYGLAIALARTGETGHAITLLESAPRTPASACLLAELLLSQGKADQALSLLRPLAEENGPAAQRAAWLTALYLAESEQPKVAIAWIENHWDFANSLAGQELLARLALRQDAPERARDIYEDIEEESVEAKVYLSKIAYAQQDWERARELTRQLIATNPDEPAFWRNMEAIDKAENTTP